MNNENNIFGSKNFRTITFSPFLILVSMVTGLIKGKIEDKRMTILLCRIFILSCQDRYRFDIGDINHQTFPLAQCQELGARFYTHYEIVEGLYFRRSHNTISDILWHNHSWKSRSSAPKVKVVKFEKCFGPNFFRTFHYAILDILMAKVVCMKGNTKNVFQLKCSIIS